MLLCRSSKLANLFGVEETKGANESLTYTAPKQPKKKSGGKSADITYIYKATLCFLTSVYLKTFKTTDKNIQSLIITKTIISDDGQAGNANAPSLLHAVAAHTYKL